MANINVSPILNMPAFKQTITVLRRGTGIRNQYGEFDQTQPDTILTLSGSVQPFKGRDRLDLPEAERVSNGIMIYVSNKENIEAIRVGTGQTDGDIVVFQGINYLIKSIKDYNVYGHYEITATRLEGQSN